MWDFFKQTKEFYMQMSLIELTYSSIDLFMDAQLIINFLFIQLKNIDEIR